MRRPFLGVLAVTVAAPYLVVFLLSFADLMSGDSVGIREPLDLLKVVRLGTFGLMITSSGEPPLIRILLCAVVLLGAGSPALAQSSNPAPAAQAGEADDAGLQAVASKLNAYVALMNRTLRASESIARDESWVDMTTGPVDKNRVFGVYSLYDVADEIADARAALDREPRLTELDAGMRAYIEAYSRLAPMIDEADGYYERKDYLADNLARGREIHAWLAPAAQAFLAARATIERGFNAERARLAPRELAAIEPREGRKARWHRANLMLAARRILDDLSQYDGYTLDVAAFDTDVTRLADGVKEFEDYRKSDPEALGNLQGAIRSFLAAAQGLREALQPVTLKPLKNESRRGGSQQLQALVNAYNALAQSRQQRRRLTAPRPARMPARRNQRTALRRRAIAGG